MILVKSLIILSMVGFMAWFVVSAVLYRLVKANSKVFYKLEVHYKMVELGLDNRAYFESLLGNRIVRFVDLGIVYVSKADRAKLWPESPFDMKKNNYTIIAQFEIEKLAFGGYGVVQLISVKKSIGLPKISK